MSEIELLYKNAGVKKVIPDICSNYEGDCIGCIGYIKGQKPYCKSVDYPPFTPEKQLELLLFCTIWGQVHIIKGIDNEYRIENCCYRYGYQPTIAEAIANHLNEKWHILTTEEQEQIRSILNG